MGIVSDGALSTTVDAIPQLLWPVPEHWTLEDAATVPLPYLQALYCLVSLHKSGTYLTCRLLWNHEKHTATSLGINGRIVGLINCRYRCPKSRTKMYDRSLKQDYRRC